MKVLHLPYNICGIPSNISKAFRNLGHRSDVLEFYEKKIPVIGTEADYILFRKKQGNLYSRNSKIALFFCYALAKYNVFQFHTSATLFPKYIDAKIINFIKKKYFIYHHGSDVIGNNNYLTHVPHAKNAKAIFISTPDLYRYVPKSAILMPQAISTEFLSSYKKNKIFYDHKESPIIITHAVYAKEVIKTKGSHIISEAIDKLKAKGVNIDYRFYIGKPHEFIIEQISSADIHIDQIIYGWHGTISAEAMALGIPTICYISPEFESFMGDLPLFNANKDNLVDKIEQLIFNLNLRKELSNKGVEYVSKVHSKKVIAKKMLNIYNQ